METIVIGADLFTCQRTYVDKDAPTVNESGEESLLLAHSISPTDPEDFIWIMFDLSVLRGKKRILSAKISLEKNSITPAHSFVSISEPAGPVPNEQLLTYANLPAVVSLGIPNVDVDAAEDVIEFDISRIITEWVESRRPNKGLILQVVKPDPDADVSMDFIGSRPPTSGFPFLTIKIDPTVKPPSRK